MTDIPEDLRKRIRSGAEMLEVQAGTWSDNFQLAVECMAVLYLMRGRGDVREWVVSVVGNPDPHGFLAGVEAAVQK